MRKKSRPRGRLSTGWVAVLPQTGGGGGGTDASGGAELVVVLCGVVWTGGRVVGTGEACGAVADGVVLGTGAGAAAGALWIGTGTSCGAAITGAAGSAGADGSSVRRGVAARR